MPNRFALNLHNRVPAIARLDAETNERRAPKYRDSIPLPLVHPLLARDIAQLQNSDHVAVNSLVTPALDEYTRAMRAAREDWQANQDDLNSRRKAYQDWQNR